METTLNIHYAIPGELWSKLQPLLQKLTESGIGYSVEPGGLQLYAAIKTEEWKKQIDSFRTQAEILLGYPIGDIFDGYECKPYR